MEYQEVSSDELEEIVEGNSDEDFVILDVRTSQEFDQGHIPNAIQVDFYNPHFRDEIARLDKERTYYVVCRSGARSGKTCSMMSEMGFEQVYNLEGGMLRWSGDIE